jgi:SMC interacting uncharacterized protein involved in chromosome segregation
MRGMGWIIAIILAVLLFFVSKGCEEAKGKASRNERLLEETRKIMLKADSAKKASDKLVDTLKAEVRRYDNLVTDLYQHKEKAEAALDKITGRISMLSARIQQSHINKDTVKIVMDCDSLVAENYNLIGVIQEKDAFADSLIAIYEERDALKDSIIQNRENLNSDMRIALDKVSGDLITVLNEKPARVSAWNRWIKPGITFVIGGIVVNELKK